MGMTESKRNPVDVLIVDDEPGVQQLLSAILKTKSYSCNVASNGKEAFSLTMANEYKLVLMDMKMPEWDGLTTVRSLDFIQEDQKIIVVSGYLDEETIRSLDKEPLVDSYITKPFDTIEILDAVERILGY